MNEIKVVRKVILNIIDLHDQPLRMQRSPPGVAKIFQIKKTKRYDKSNRYFRYDHKSVLVEMKFIRNSILNNLYLKDKLPILQLISLYGSLQS